MYSKTGKKSILFSHSQGGMPGWESARYTNNIASIIAIEPGVAPSVDGDDYNALVQKKIPIAFYYGDYIGTNFTDVPAANMWNFMRSSAYTFEERYKNEGLTCTIYNLPDEGIYGNDHMMFQDLNNDILADHIEKWILNNVEGSGEDPDRVPSSNDAKNFKSLGLIFLLLGILI